MQLEGVLIPDALDAFAVFARHRNFTTAAAELHISQPSLHVKIKKLSAALGHTLYERDGRVLTLTDAGRRLAAFAADTRRAAEDFHSDLDMGSSDLHVATGRGALRWVIGDAVAALTAGGQRVRVIVGGRDELLGAVHDGSADLAVLAFDRPPAELEHVEIASFPQTLLIAASHPLARRSTITIADLDGLDVVLPPRGRPHRMLLERALLDVGAATTVTAEVDGWDLLTHLAVLGVGATVVNGCVRPPDGMRAVTIRDLPATRYWAAWRPQRRRVAAALQERLTVRRRRR